MSALGHKRTYAVQYAMSALHPIATAKADIRWWIMASGAGHSRRVFCAGPKNDSLLSSSTNRGPARPSEGVTLCVDGHASVVGLGRQQTERGCAISRLFHQLFVGLVIKRAGVTDFATVDNEAAYLSFAHRGLHRSRRLAMFQCEFTRFFQLLQKRRYSHLSANCTPMLQLCYASRDPFISFQPDTKARCESNPRRVLNRRLLR